MTEREMEDLLAKYPEKFFQRRILTLKGRQVTLPGGMRFDLEYEDQDGNSHLIELKAVAAKLEHVEQLTKYKKGLVEQGRKRIWLWLIAPTIPKNLIEFLDDNGIQHAEITKAEYKQVAEEVGYEFSSEKGKDMPDASMRTSTAPRLPAPSSHAVNTGTQSRETSWYFWVDGDGRRFLLAFVNGKGSCSLRPFDADTGVAFKRPPNQRGDYQLVYRDTLKSALSLPVKPKVSLEKDCKERLPSPLLEELRRYIPKASK